MRVVGLLLLAASSAGAHADAGPLPHDQTARFLGVDTCGSSECHGSQTPWRNATVLMSERRIWEAHDPHAKAYASLTSPRGQKIAQNLGFADVTKAPECLVCHSTFVPENQRGPRFRLDAGVTCESCHGPGSRFLSTHVQTTASHAGNIAAGLYPTNEPGARASLCLSCHQGDTVRRISHQLYGAGHPRLRFELDTYSVNQPYHFNPDADYRRRKAVVSHFQMWAEGQLQAARTLLMQTGSQQHAGIFPEFAFYDCHACHRAIGDTSHMPRLNAGIAAGKPYLIDAPLIMLRGVAAVAAPRLVERLRTETRSLHQSTNPNDRAAAAARLETTVAALEQAIKTRTAHTSDGAVVVQTLMSEAEREHPLPFTAAEATAMGLSTLLVAEKESGRLLGADYVSVQHALDGVYAALGDEYTYRPAELEAALKTLAAALPKSTPSPK